MHIYLIYLLNFAPLRNLPLSPTSLLFLNTEESIHARCSRLYSRRLHKWSSLVRKNGKSRSSVARRCTQVSVLTSSYGGRMPAYFMSKQTSVPVACAATNLVRRD